jgi:hypothetical protein
VQIVKFRVSPEGETSVRQLRDKIFKNVVNPHNDYGYDGKTRSLSRQFVLDSQK